MRRVSLALALFLLPAAVFAADFSMYISPTSQKVGCSGGTVTYRITVKPMAGFSGDVALAVSGLPTGMTATFSPNPTPTASTMTLTVSASAPKGSYPFRVLGTSNGVTHWTKGTITKTNGK